MKFSKDAAASGLSVATIDGIAQPSAIGNYISNDVPMEYPAVMKQWSEAIRDTGRHVWYRMSTSQHCLDRTVFLNELKALMLNHAGLWHSGDIIDGDSEAENSCIWTTQYGCGVQSSCTPCNASASNTPCAPVLQFNNFECGLTQTEDNALAQLGKSGLYTGIRSTDPGTASHQLSAATVSCDHNYVTIDEYSDQNATDGTTAAAEQLSALNQIHNVWPNALIVVGETGYRLSQDVSDSTQQSVLQAEYNAIVGANLTWLRGWSYWVGAGNCADGGCTHILSKGSSGWAQRPAAATLGAFYAAEGA